MPAGLTICSICGYDKETSTTASERRFSKRQSAADESGRVEIDFRTRAWRTAKKIGTRLAVILACVLLHAVLFKSDTGLVLLKLEGILIAPYFCFAWACRIVGEDRPAPGRTLAILAATVLLPLVGVGIFSGRSAGPTAREVILGVTRDTILSGPDQAVQRLSDRINDDSRNTLSDQDRKFWGLQEREVWGIVVGLVAALVVFCLQMESDLLVAALIFVIFLVLLSAVVGGSLLLFSVLSFAFS